MYEDRDDFALLRIVRSDEYTAEGRSEAYSLLLARGFTETSIAEAPLDPILPIEDDFPFIPMRSSDDRSVAQVLASATYRRRLHRITITMVFVAAVLLIVAMFSPENAIPGVAQLLVLIHFLTHGLFWERPARILLLRPFNTQRQRLGLSHLVRNQLSFFGHVYTLQDSLFRGSGGYLPGSGSWLWGPMRRAFAFHTVVASDVDLLHLQKAIGRRIRRNLNWAASTTRLFPVSSDPQYWRRTIQLLLNSCDVIVVDASDERSNVAWEMAEIARCKLSARTIAITCASDPSIAIATATIASPEANCPVFQYDSMWGEIVESQQFLLAVAERVLL
jgi:hypothetical protein